jgi:ParB-like chromosome segregation protein Spo0J
MKDLQFHPAAEIFPLMEDEPFDELVEDIRQHGLQVKIELYEGMVLDGRNRYKACLLAQKTILTTDVDDFVSDPVAHVVSLNARRRHLTKSQLAIAAGRAEGLYEAEKARAEERLHLAKGRGVKGVETVSDLNESGKTRDKVGQQFGISGPLVTRGRRVVKEGAPELAKAVEAGVMDVSEAAGLIRAGVGKDEQKRIAEEAIATGKKPRAHPGRGRHAGRGSDGAPTIRTRATAAMQLVTIAISQLERIRSDDPERDKAFTKLTRWIERNWKCPQS